MRVVVKSINRQADQQRQLRRAVSEAEDNIRKLARLARDEAEEIVENSVRPKSLSKLF